MKHLNIYEKLVDYNDAVPNLPVTHLAKINEEEKVLGYPDGDIIPVEYLASDGSAWIDTGVVIKDNPRVVINIYMTGSLDKDVFGFPSNAQPSFIGNISASSSKQSFQYYRYYTTSSRGSALNSTVPFNTWAEWDMSNVVKCNGSTLATYNRESFAANNQTLRLFNGRGYITTNVVRVGATKIYDGDVLKRDFIPVRLGNVGYMFVWVSKKLFGNVGTGSFTFGSDIVPVEYLQSSGAEWIDTKVFGYMNHTYKLDFQQINTQSYRIWGAFGQSSYAGYNMSLTYANSTTWMIRWESTSSNQRGVSFAPIDANRHKIKISNGEIYFDGISKGKSTGHDSLCSINYNLFLFTCNPADTTPSSNAQIKIYSYEDINEHGQLIRQMVPVRMGTTGYMLDKIEWKLYANAGARSFTYGADQSGLKIMTTKSF